MSHFDSHSAPGIGVLLPQITRVEWNSWPLFADFVPVESGGWNHVRVSELGNRFSLEECFHRPQILHESESILTIAIWMHFKPRKISPTKYVLAFWSGHDLILWSDDHDLSLSHCPRCPKLFLTQKRVPLQNQICGICDNGARPFDLVAASTGSVSCRWVTVRFWKLAHHQRCG